MTLTNELCKELSEYVYGKKGIYARNAFLQISLKDVVDNKLIKDDYYFNGASGCTAAFYYNETTNEGVIAYRGTEENSKRDYLADLDIGTGIVPQQYYDAIAFYEAIAYSEQYKNAAIALTGHSLGGGLAQLVSTYACNRQNGAKEYLTYTFNAPGVYKTAKKLGFIINLNYPITNYSVMNDWCGMLDMHIGKLLVLPPRKIESDPLNLDTHSKILSEDLSKSLPKPAGFNEQEALALWYYDKNNNHSYSGLSTVIAKLAARTSVSALKNAIQILRNNPQFIEHEFRYKTLNKTYILGLPEKENIIIGSKDNEIIYGGNKTDSMTGGSGRDELHGFEGNDIIRGGSGNDTLYAGEGNDTLYGDAGNDVLYTGVSGNSTLYGGSGNDVLVVRPMPYAELKKKWNLKRN